MRGDHNATVVNLEDLTANGVTGNKKLHLTRQIFTFTCGPQFNTFFVTLTPGEYVQISCANGPIRIRVGCGEQFTTLVATYNLRSGQAVQVTCLG
ncbi:MAG: hypothetical protein ACE3JP_05150 [Ectobacillus sp.]